MNELFYGHKNAQWAFWQNNVRHLPALLENFKAR